MYAAQVSGFGFNPLSKVKKGVKAAGRGVTTAAKKAASVARVIASSAWKAAAAPVRAKALVLVNRRARKIAWDRRRTTAPTPAEYAEARRWAQGEFRKEGAKGALIATLIGAPAEGVLLGSFGMISPVWLLTPAAPIALIVIITQLLTRHSGKSAAAPAEDPSKAKPPAEEVPAEEPPSEEAPSEEEEAPAEEPTPEEEPPPSDEEPVSGLGAAPLSTSEKVAVAGLFATLLGAAGYGAYRAFRR